MLNLKDLHKYAYRFTQPALLLPTLAIGVGGVMLWELCFNPDWLSSPVESNSLNKVEDLGPDDGLSSEERAIAADIDISPLAQQAKSTSIKNYNLSKQNKESNKLFEDLQTRQKSDSLVTAHYDLLPHKKSEEYLGIKPKLSQSEDQATNPPVLSDNDVWEKLGLQTKMRLGGGLKEDDYRSKNREYSGLKIFNGKIRSDHNLDPKIKDDESISKPKNQLNEEVLQRLSDDQRNNSNSQIELPRPLAQNEFETPSRITPNNVNPPENQLNSDNLQRNPVTEYPTNNLAPNNNLYPTNNLAPIPISPDPRQSVNNNNYGGNVNTSSHQTVFPEIVNTPESNVNTSSVMPLSVPNAVNNTDNINTPIMPITPRQIENNPDVIEQGLGSLQQSPITPGMTPTQTELDKTNPP